MNTNIDTDLRWNNAFTLSLAILEDWAAGKAQLGLADAAWDYLTSTDHNEAVDRASSIIAGALLGPHTMLHNGETAVSRDCALMVDFTCAGFPSTEELDVATIDELARLETADITHSDWACPDSTEEVI